MKRGRTDAYSGEVPLVAQVLDDRAHAVVAVVASLRLRAGLPQLRVQVIEKDYQMVPVDLHLELSLVAAGIVFDRYAYS